MFRDSSRIAMARSVGGLVWWNTLRLSSTPAYGGELPAINYLLRDS
jgi:hypothetical protein